MRGMQPPPGSVVVTACRSLAGRQAADGVDVKLSQHIDQKKQEASDCQQSIVHARQAAEKLEEDIRLARREKDLALAKKQQEVDELRARVNNSSVRLLLLPARRYAARVFATATCLSVCLDVCHTPVLCLAERKQDRKMCTF